MKSHHKTPIFDPGAHRDVRPAGAGASSAGLCRLGWAGRSSRQVAKLGSSVGRSLGNHWKITGKRETHWQIIGEMTGKLIKGNILCSKSWDKYTKNMQENSWKMNEIDGL